MPTISKIYELSKTQSELDFVDVQLQTDNRLFLDPFAISQHPGRFAQECHNTLLGFFQRVVDCIRSGEIDEAKELLGYLREPNETRLGFSKRQPQGAGIGRLQAEQLFGALKDSTAVRTGFISSLEECELMIDGISRDKLSDLSTNLIRAHLVAYTQEQCKLHGISIQSMPLPPVFDVNSMTWVSKYVDIPVAKNGPILLVPKAFVRFDPAYEHQQYYRHYVLNYLQVESLNAGSSLVHTLKNKKKVVYKKELEARFPCTKDFLYNFSRQNPKVLKEYRDNLKKLEVASRDKEIDPIDEAPIAAMLAETLKSIPSGDKDADPYHKLMVGIVEFIFFPQLIYPRREERIHEGRKRIDILVENNAKSGIFHRLHSIRKLPCAFVAFECKNYRTDVGNPEIDQLQGRFSVNRGKLGFLCCRQFQDAPTFIKRCIDTFKDDRGLILPLDDAIIFHCLKLIKDDRRQGLEGLLTELVNQVWVS